MPFGLVWSEPGASNGQLLSRSRPFSVVRSISIVTYGAWIAMDASRATFMYPQDTVKPFPLSLPFLSPLQPPYLIPSLSPFNVATADLPSKGDSAARHVTHRRPPSFSARRNVLVAHRPAGRLRSVPPSSPSIVITLVARIPPEGDFVIIPTLSLRSLRSFLIHHSTVDSPLTEFWSV